MAKSGNSDILDAMVIWSELRRYAMSRNEFVLDDDGLFAYTLSLPGGRTQRIFVQRLELLGREFIELRTLVCREEEFEPREALRQSAEARLGSFALEDGVYYLQHRLNLETIDFSTFDETANMLARRGDKLEERYSGRDIF